MPARHMPLASIASALSGDMLGNEHRKSSSAVGSSPAVSTRRACEGDAACWVVCFWQHAQMRCTRCCVSLGLVLRRRRRLQSDPLADASRSASSAACTEACAGSTSRTMKAMSHVVDRRHACSCNLCAKCCCLSNSPASMSDIKTTRAITPTSGQLKDTSGTEMPERSITTAPARSRCRMVLHRLLRLPTPPERLSTTSHGCGSPTSPPTNRLSEASADGPAVGSPPSVPRANCMTGALAAAGGGVLAVAAWACGSSAEAARCTLHESRTNVCAEPSNASKLRASSASGALPNS
mmetsp:Transcript_13019/g.45159  ORF Transcript_13019/g.45159 Transcript_13019/m.45159 type:complete len:294 (-) Transcript_13019:1079-1960(-)